MHAIGDRLYAHVHLPLSYRQFDNIMFGQKHENMTLPYQAEYDASETRLHEYYITGEFDENIVCVFDVVSIDVGTKQ